MFTYKWLVAERQRRHTHAETMKRYNARPGNGRVAFTTATMRKGWCGSEAPVYEALYADGARLRFSFFQIPGKEYDFERGRTVARRAYPRSRLVNGWIHHNPPGGKSVTLHDNMESAEKPRRVNYKAILQRIVDAGRAGTVDELEAAWNEAAAVLA